MSTRLEQTIEALEDRAFSAEEVAGFEKLVWDVYQAAFGDEKTLRWMLFVRALETSSHVLPDESDLAVARHVTDTYGEVFPDIARDIDRAKVAAAVRAWREDRNYFEAIRAALLSVIDETQVPKARSMATKWSEATTATPWKAPSKRRPRRRGTLEQPRGIHPEDRPKRRGRSF